MMSSLIINKMEFLAEKLDSSPEENNIGKSNGNLFVFFFFFEREYNWYISRASKLGPMD